MPRDKQKQREHNKKWEDNNKIWRKAYNEKHRERIYSANRNHTLKRLYGITLDDYNNLYTDQQGCCSICNKHQSALSDSRTLAVDHNHITGKVRGLLYSSCNKALGLFEDSFILLEKAANYLKEKDNV